jgi:hypothetical protein
LVASRGSEEVEVVVTPNEDGEVFLQIAPYRTPGFLGRLMKKEPSATRESVQAVAELAHHYLTAKGFGSQRWRWDGYPDDATGTASPQPFRVPPVPPAFG